MRRPPGLTRRCLACAASLAPFEGPSTRCGGCGAVNLRRDLETYWTRERRWVLRERRLTQAWLALVAVAASPVLYYGLTGFWIARRLLLSSRMAS